MSSAVQLSRGSVVALMADIGWKSASSWDNSRLSSKLKDIKDVAPETYNPADPDIAAVYSTVCEAIDNAKRSGSELVFEITGDAASFVNQDSATPAASHESNGKGDSGDKPKEVFDPVAFAAWLSENGLPVPQEGSKQYSMLKTLYSQQTRKAGRPSYRKPKSDKNAIKLPGIRPVRSRLYLAAEVIMKHGLEKGITDEHIKDLNELHGVKNDAESRGRLRSAWQVLNGYLKKFEPAIDSKRGEGPTARRRKKKEEKTETQAPASTTA